MQNKLRAKLLITMSNIVALVFAFSTSIIIFWYPFSYFLGNKITAWIGLPVTMLLTVLGLIIGSYPFSYISRQRKDRLGFFGRLQKTLDLDE